MADATPPPPKVPVQYVADDYKEVNPYVPFAFYNQPMLTLMEEQAKGTWSPNKWTKAVDIYNQAANIGTKYENFSKTWFNEHGNPTIGYGGRDVDPRYIGKKEISQQEALDLMLGGYKERDKQLMKYPAYQAMTPNQKAGFLDLAYTLGNGNFGSYTDMSHYLTDAKYIPQIIQNIPSFRKQNGVIRKGLERRRADEANLMLQKDQEQEYLPIFVKGYGY